MATQRRSSFQGFNRRRPMIRSALALTAASLAIPGSAAAYWVGGGFSGGGGGNAVPASATVVPHQFILHRDGSKAAAFVAEPSAGATVTGLAPDSTGATR
jgi:hypothetical protein